MDDAERIPIDLGYEVASAAEAGSHRRTTLREDGTLVIDILAPEPCAPEPTTEQEIVVCAEVPGEEPQLAAPPSPTALEKLGQALHTKVGPLELGSIDRGDGTRAFGAQFRF